MHSPEPATGRLSHRRLIRVATWCTLAVAVVFFAAAIAGVAVSRPFLPGLQKLFGVSLALVRLRNETGFAQENLQLFSALYCCFGSLPFS